MRGDLHLHSAYSDGSATVIELIQQAVSKGLTHISPLPTMTGCRAAVIFRRSLL